MTEVTTGSRDELAEVDELYRRLSARAPGRPGEWVRRKVQAYAAQQSAERAVREGANVGDKPSPVTPAPKVAPKATAMAPPAAKKPLGVPVILAGLGLLVLAIFIVLPRFMTTHDQSTAVPPPPAPLAPLAEATPRVAQAPTPTSSEPATQAPATQSSEPTTSPADAAMSHTPAPLPASLTSAKANAAPRARPQPKAPSVAHQSEPVAARLATRATRNARPQALPAAATVNNSAPATGPAPATPASGSSATNTQVASSPALTSAMSPPAPQAASAVPSDEFYQAAQRGDLKELQTGFAGNIDVNARDPKGHTALILAIQHGEVDAVKALLAHGASTTLPDSHGTTPMGAAHERGNFEITRIVERDTQH
jgi:hypothetical protein